MVLASVRGMSFKLSDLHPGSTHSAPHARLIGLSLSGNFESGSRKVISNQSLNLHLICLPPKQCGDRNFQLFAFAVNQLHLPVLFKVLCSSLNKGASRHIKTFHISLTSICLLPLSKTHFPADNDTFHL